MSSQVESSSSSSEMIVPARRNGLHFTKCKEEGDRFAFVGTVIQSLLQH